MLAYSQEHFSTTFPRTWRTLLDPKQGLWQISEHREMLLPVVPVYVCIHLSSLTHTQSRNAPGCACWLNFSCFSPKAILQKDVFDFLFVIIYLFFLFYSFQYALKKDQQGQAIVTGTTLGLPSAVLLSPYKLFSTLQPEWSLRKDPPA